MSVRNDEPAEPGWQVMEGRKISISVCDVDGKLWERFIMEENKHYTVKS